MKTITIMLPPSKIDKELSELANDTEHAGHEDNADEERQQVRNKLLHI